jgi:DNA (cytosine-5)-methyltransferase 1
LTRPPKCGELTPDMTGVTRALSIFSGIGGLDLGAQAAGVSVDLATDSDDEALQIHAEALGARVVVGDINDVLAGRLRESWGPSAPRMLIGGPPCTAFSHAGFWLENKRAGRDPAAAMLSSYLRCLREFGPDSFVLENVPGLAFKTHRKSLKVIIDGAKAEGYAVSSAILNAAALGVPQARHRLFVVGVKGGAAVDLDTWPAYPRRSAGWAIADLDSSEGAEPDELPGKRYRDLLTRVPNGGNYLAFTSERGCPDPQFTYRGRYWSFLLKLDPLQPSPTVPAQRITYNGPFHWSNRHLRIRELARLQGFPDWFPLSPVLATARRHVGNAVPPLLAAAVIWRVRQALGDVGSDASLPDLLSHAADPAASCVEVLAAYPRANAPEERAA